MNRQDNCPFSEVSGWTTGWVPWLGGPAGWTLLSNGINGWPPRSFRAVGSVPWSSGAISSSLQSSLASEVRSYILWPRDATDRTLWLGRVKHWALQLFLVRWSLRLFSPARWYHWLDSGGLGVHRQVFTFRQGLRLWSMFWWTHRLCPKVRQDYKLCFAMKCVAELQYWARLLADLSCWEGPVVSSIWMGLETMLRDLQGSLCRIPCQAEL